MTPYAIRVTSQERVRAALAELGLPSELTEFDASTHTAQDAANAVGCELGQIVKTLFFLAEGRATMALVAGDRQVDTALLAQLLGVGRKRLKMGSPDEVLEYTGYPVGGVAPVGALNPCDVVVDESLQRFAQIWAAAGNGNTVFPVGTLALVNATNGQWAAITKEPA
jgi:Cys-tRNA(Pro) deacylase